MNVLSSFSKVSSWSDMNCAPWKYLKIISLTLPFHFSARGATDDRLHFSLSSKNCKSEDWYQHSKRTIVGFKHPVDEKKNVEEIPTNLPTAEQTKVQHYSAAFHQYARPKIWIYSIVAIVQTFRCYMKGNRPPKQIKREIIQIWLLSNCSSIELIFLNGKTEAPRSCSCLDVSSPGCSWLVM